MQQTNWGLSEDLLLDGTGRQKGSGVTGHGGPQEVLFDEVKGAVEFRVADKL